MIKKVVTGVIIAGVVVLAGLWAASPVLAGKAIIRAAERGDEAALERLVDFPALRESMKGELNDLLVAEMRNDPRVVENGLGGLTTMLAPMFISGAVDTVVTPQGVAAMVTTARAPEADGTPPPDSAADRKEPNLHKAWGYRSLDVFAITLTDRDRPQNSLALLLERRGWFTWQLAAVDLRTEP
ncbi:DUF2939 domain-containing protein [Brevundimonas sp.]|uniref:DUF2939 domain-containing protein n=1 Tax=Brevundimonas sp. TaxID=1871086 RepID=UPI00356A4349